MQILYNRHIPSNLKQQCDSATAIGKDKLRNKFRKKTKKKQRAEH